MHVVKYILTNENDFKFEKQ